MFDFDKNNKMTPRPDHEPKFDPSSKVDRKIIMLVLLGLLAVAILIGVFVLIYELGLWAI